MAEILARVFLGDVTMAARPVQENSLDGAHDRPRAPGHQGKKAQAVCAHTQAPGKKINSNKNASSITSPAPSPTHTNALLHGGVPIVSILHIATLHEATPRPPPTQPNPKPQASPHSTHHMQPAVLAHHLCLVTTWSRGGRSIGRRNGIWIWTTIHEGHPWGIVKDSYDVLKGEGKGREGEGGGGMR